MSLDLDANEIMLELHKGCISDKFTYRGCIVIVFSQVTVCKVVSYRFVRPGGEGIHQDDVV